MRQVRILPAAPLEEFHGMPWSSCTPPRSARNVDIDVSRPTTHPRPGTRGSVRERAGGLRDRRCLSSRTYTVAVYVRHERMNARAAPACSLSVKYKSRHVCLSSAARQLRSPWLVLLARYGFESFPLYLLRRSLHCCTLLSPKRFPWSCSSLRVS